MTTKQKLPKQIRQGDVLLIKMPRKPKDLGSEVPMEKLGPVLALGEATGHHHTVVAEPETYKPELDLPDDHLRKWARDQIQQCIDQHQTLKSVADGPAARLFRNGETDTLIVSRHTILRHEEHDCVALSPGAWRVVRQRELVEGEVRRVED